MIEIYIPERLRGVGLPPEQALWQFERRIGNDRLTRKQFEIFRPREYRALFDPWHGPDHTGDTTILGVADALYAQYFGFQSNIEAVGRACGHHDMEHPGGTTFDSEHGTRAADWIRRNLLNVTDEEREEIALAVEQHVPEEEFGISNTAKALKDGDSLSRVRFGDEKWGLDPKYLNRFPFTRELLIGVAILQNNETQRLMSIGFANGDGYSCAIQAGINIGTVRG